MHAGQVGDPGRQPRRAERAVGVRGVRGDGQVGRVGAGQERRVRRLGPSCARDRTHGEAADETDEHDDGEVSPPPAAEGGPEAVPGDAKNLTAHGGRLSPRFCSLTSTSMSGTRPADPSQTESDLLQEHGQGGQLVCQCRSSTTRIPRGTDCAGPLVQPRTSASPTPRTQAGSRAGRPRRRRSRAPSRPWPEPRRPLPAGSRSGRWCR